MPIPRPPRRPERYFRAQDVLEKSGGAARRPEATLGAIFTEIGGWMGRCFGQRAYLDPLLMAAAPEVQKMRGKGSARPNYARNDQHMEWTESNQTTGNLSMYTLKHAISR